MQIVQPLSYCNPVMDVRRLLLMYCTMYTAVPPFVEYRFDRNILTRSATTVLYWYRYGTSTYLYIYILLQICMKTAQDFSQSLTLLDNNIMVKMWRARTYTNKARWLPVE